MAASPSGIYTRFVGGSGGQPVEARGHTGPTA